MANSPYTDLIDNVLPFLAADPSDPVTEVAIRRAAIEFIAGSWVWQILADPIAVTAGVASYALSAPAGASVSAVLDAQLDGDPLTAKALAWLNANLPNWRMQPGTPSYYTQTDSENIVLAPLPAWASSYGLTVTLALQPADASSEIPEWIASQYGRYIADGAVAILMLMPGKPWTDLSNGADRRTRFEQQIADARADAIAALGAAPLRTTSQH